VTVNETARKFGHPDTLLAELDHWWILLRPAQVTLGSLVLVCRDPARRFGELPARAAGELPRAAGAIEKALGEAFRFDRINYLMLMMVDPDVHFHVIPRYEGERELAGRRFRDAFWPGPPDVTQRLDLDEQAFEALRRELAPRFDPGGGKG